MYSSEIKKPDKISFLALGGLAEVGKNMYCIEVNDDIFIIDCGVLFPDDTLPGIDYVIPSFQYLLDKKDKIRGLFITHGHEDHIGAIPFFLKQLPIDNIYACGIAYDLIVSKLEEHNIKKNIIKYNTNSVYKFGTTEVSFILLNHSIPDMHGICIKTNQGYIFHTGDFKIDFTPVGPKADYQRLAKIGSEGVLLLLSDSTNAEKKNLIESEKIIGESITTLFSRIKGRIVIATFASNLYRVKQIIDAAVLTNRKVAILGRSMQKVVDISIKTKYLTVDPKTFIKAENINKTPLEKIVVLCTGTQGEPLAALSRIATGNHRFMSANSKDTVLLSSSIIPGNFVDINQTINLLSKKGATVITDGPLANIHASGHGSQNDLKLMLSLLKPKYFIPIHGEHRMLKIHKQLAIDVGVPEKNILVLDNGDYVEITPDNINVTQKIPCYSQYMDQSGYSAITNNIIRERKLLSEEGMLSVIITINQANNKIACEPNLITRGFVYMKEEDKLLNNIIILSKIAVSNYLLKNKVINETDLKELIINSLKDKIAGITNRYPVILPIIHFIN